MPCRSEMIDLQIRLHISIVVRFYVLHSELTNYIHFRDVRNQIYMSEYLAHSYREFRSLVADWLFYLTFYGGIGSRVMHV